MARQFDPYSVLRTEPDMRQEFINTIDGSYPEISKKQVFVLRKMRVSDGQLVRCSCFSSITHESDKDYFCPICLGDGILWDESFVYGYKVIPTGTTRNISREVLIPPGNINIPYITFYFKYDLPITILSQHTISDRIITLVTGLDGLPVRPYERESVYRIVAAIDFRSDNGKLEYWKLDCYEEQVKFLNGPKG